MKYAFELINLTKYYSDFTLDHINLQGDIGKVIGYVGPNGSGKTTTLNCMMRLLKPDLGTVKIFDIVNDPNDVSWKFKTGFVNDTPMFFEHWTVEQNLKFIGSFYPDWDRQYMDNLCMRFNLDKKKRANTLSKGNRVKLALVAALSHHPPFLMMDEATAGLDPVVHSEVIDALWEHMESGQNTIFYSTHNMADISQLADEIAFLDNGKLLAKATKESLLSHWRTITFKLDKKLDRIAFAYYFRGTDNEYQIVSYDFENTLSLLNNAGATNIQTTLMTIEDIVVWILKKGITLVNDINYLKGQD